MKILYLVFVFALIQPAFAQDGARVRDWIDKRKAAHADAAPASDSERGFDIYVPNGLPPKGGRSLVVALHGGSGWSTQFQRTLGLDAVAEREKFIVLYLNGTPVARGLPDQRKGWNGGTCCGLPVKKNIDDVSYIVAATEKIAREYGVARSRIFVTGHSNGAIMAARLLCEANLFQSAVLISGALNLPGAGCVQAKGKRLLAIHGVNDDNYPLNGGVGGKSVAGTDFVSQTDSQKIFRAAGAEYEIMKVAGAEHKPETISVALTQQTGKTLPETVAAFFGLAGKEQGR